MDLEQQIKWTNRHNGTEINAIRESLLKLLRILEEQEKKDNLMRMFDPSADGLNKAREIWRQNVFDLISGAVCKHYSVDIAHVKRKNKAIKLVKPRRMICYMMRKLTPMSLVQIGALLNRDHSTVIHNVRKMEGEIGIYPEVMEDVHAIEWMIQEKQDKE